MPRRLLPLVVAALVSVAGCTTVTPGPDPAPAGSRRTLPPNAPAVPSVLRAPAGDPADRAALVRTGKGHPDRPGPAARTRGPASGAPASAAPSPATASPARAPRAEHRPSGRHPVPRPRTVSRPPAAVMRDLCRRADGVAAPEVVRLCRKTYG